MRRADFRLSWFSFRTDSDCVAVISSLGIPLEYVSPESIAKGSRAEALDGFSQSNLRRATCAMRLAQRQVVWE